MKKISVYLVLVSLMLFTGCRFLGGKKVRGNGNVVTQERSVGSFRGIRSSGSFDVVIANGPAQSVRIEAEDNLQEYIEAVVEGDVLSIRTREGFRLSPKKDLKIFVTSSSLNEVKVSGSGDITSEGTISVSNPMKFEINGSGDIKVNVDAPEVEAEISGSGDMHLEGNVKSFRSEINGNGDIKAMNLKSEETKVQINGSGDAEVFGSVRLEVVVRGSGDVVYRGNGQVISDIKGSGSVTKKD
ncbi:MAG TPA: head GIN domain-containing protein [Flavitalea sp.]|nr:head GIN domain-containing protein [Flavitalea sp.]